MTAPGTRGPQARFAAAQAVVAARLGLPLTQANVFIEINPDLMGDLKRTGGGVQLDQSVYQQWFKDLPDPKATERVTAVATMAAAGAVSEGYDGNYPGTPGQNIVLQTLVGIAGNLGVGEGATVNWVGQRVQEAHEILTQDGGAAWDLVRDNLEQQGRLSGDEVRQLVAESDGELSRIT